MITKKLLVLFAVTLAACSGEITLSSSQTTSSSFEGVSSISATAIDSSLTNSSSLASETTINQSSALPTLNTIWVAPMGGISSTDYYQVNQTVPSSLSNVGITIVVSIFDQNDNFYGFAYEAVVNGSGGTIRFRIGIANNTFAGIVVVSHREHVGFGVRLIDALKSQLAGKPATIAAVQEILIAASATRAGISDTYDGMIPAIEAMTLHYSTNID
jgi:hypothetical protein